MSRPPAYHVAAGLNHMHGATFSAAEAKMVRCAIMALLAATALGGCGGASPADNVHAAPDATPTEAELAADAALANEAAADEAADTNNFGGDAAAMDARNGQ